MMYFRLVCQQIKGIINAMLAIYEKINHIPINFMMVYLAERSFKFARPACKLLSMSTSNGVDEIQLFDRKCTLTLHLTKCPNIKNWMARVRGNSDYSDQCAADDI